MFKRTGLVIWLLIWFAIGTTGCPDPEDPEPPERFDVDAEEFPQQLRDNLLAQRQAHLDATDWVEDTDLYQQTRLPAVDRPVDEQDTRFQGFVDWLADDLFAPEHLETETETALTYRPDPRRVCDGLINAVGDAGTVDLSAPTPVPFEELFDQAQQLHAFGDLDVDVTTDTALMQLDADQCTRSLDAADMTLRVTSPLPEEFHLDIRTDDRQLRPAALSVAENITLVDVSVAQLGESIHHVQRVLDNTDDIAVADNEVDLQEFSGRLQWTFDVDPEVENFTETNLEVLTPVQFATDDAAVAVEPVDPLVATVVDGDAEQLETFANNAGLTAQLSLNEANTAADAELQIGAYSATAEFAAVHGDQWRWFDLGLAEPMTLNIGDELVFSFGRSLDDADNYDARIRATEEGPELTVVPPTEWTVINRFDFYAQQLDLAAWRADDITTITVDDADAPTLRLRDMLAVEVVDGTLTIDSTAADRTLIVEQGECLVARDEPIEPDDPTAPPQIAAVDVPTDGHPLLLWDVGECP